MFRPFRPLPGAWLWLILWTFWVSLPTSLWAQVGARSLVGFRTNALEVAEGVGSVPLIVYRAGNLGQTSLVRVNVAISGGGVANPAATTPLDFELGPGTEELAVTLPVLDNELAGTNRVVNLSLSSSHPQTTITNRYSALRLVVADDDGMRFRFAGTSVTVGENATNPSVTVWRDGNLRVPAAVTLRLTRGPSGQAPRLFGLITQAVEFAVGEFRKDVPVPVFPDFKVGGSDEGTVALVSPTPALAGLGNPATAILTVAEGDTRITVVGGSAPSGASTFAVGLRRTESAEPMIRGWLALEDGTAKSGVDFDAGRVPFQWGPGSNELTVEIPLRAPGAGLGLRWFRVVAQEVSGAFVPQPVGVVWLGADEVPAGGGLSVDAAARFDFGPGQIQDVAAGPGGTWYVAGGFDGYRGGPAPGVVRLLRSGEPDPTWQPTLKPNGLVRRVAALGGGRVLVTGSFGQWGGNVRRGLAVFEANGSLTEALPGLEILSVQALVRDGMGRVYLVGQRSITGLPTVVVRFGVDGLIDATWVPAAELAGGLQQAAVLESGGLLVAGVDGAARWLSETGQVADRVALTGNAADRQRWVALLDGSLLTGQPLGHWTRVGSYDTAVGQGLSDAARIWAGGPGRLFSSRAEGPLYQLRRHWADGSAEVGAGVWLDGVVSSVAAAEDGVVLVAGSFTQANGRAAAELVQLLPGTEPEGVRWHDGGGGFAQAETAGEARVPLYRGGAELDARTVEVQVGESPAVAVESGAKLTATFAAGARWTWVTVPLRDRTESGEDAVVELRLSEVDRAAGSDPAVRLRVWRNESRFAFREIDVEMDEAQQPPIGVAALPLPIGPGLVVRRVAGRAFPGQTLARFVGGSVSVRAGFVGAPFPAGADFNVSQLEQVIPFPPGTEDQTVQAAPLDDDQEQGDRVALFELVGSVEPGRGLARILLRDNDRNGVGAGVPYPFTQWATESGGTLWRAPAILDGRTYSPATPTRDDGTPRSGFSLDASLAFGTYLGQDLAGRRLFTFRVTGRTLRIQRALADGRPDAAYGSVLVSNLPGPGYQNGVSVTMGPDGSVLVFANNVDVTGGGGGANASNLVVMRFTANGVRDPQYRGGLVSLSGLTPLPSTTTLLPGADGSLVAAGVELATPERNRSHLVRLRPDGRTDPTFLTQVSREDGQVAEVQTALEDGVGGYYLRGRFDRVDGLPRRNLARVGADGRVDPTFAAVVDEPISRWVSLPGRRLVLVTEVGGAAVLRRFDEQGHPEAVRPSLAVGGTVWQLVGLPDGRLLVTGPFRAIGGVPRWYEAWLGADGTLLPEHPLALAGVLMATGPSRVQIRSRASGPVRLEASEDLRQWTSVLETNVPIGGREVEVPAGGVEGLPRFLRAIRP
jgi:hypothetical protein